ncbi:MAG TPA: hypothetical protein VFV93_07695 [Thermomicrobiales bacterium]|nr:hypothetical protein [Thermomicrobiales bacterium]
MAQRTKVSKLNPVATAREIFSIIREMSLDDLRDAALRQPRVAVVARSVGEARLVAADVFGPEAPDLVVALGEHDDWPYAAEIVLLERRARPDRSHDRYGLIVEFSADEPADRLRQAVVRAGDDLELALGRAFPALRQAAAMQVVNVTSRVNGQFALASNLPALVPVVGGVLAAGADTIVLTKNQLMMLYKLAAIHDRDLDNRFRIYQEMIPVVGAGLFWRTVARDLAAMMPFAAGAVPKVAIAFAGTFAAGMAAHLYYQEGKRVDKQRMRQYYRDALQQLRDRPDLLKSLPIPNRLRRDDDANGVIVDVDYTSDASPEMP